MVLDSKRETHLESIPRDISEAARLVYQLPRKYGRVVSVLYPCYRVFAGQQDLPK